MKIIALIITYNRLALLNKTVSKLLNQSKFLDKIIIINNGSNDGTLDYLNSLPTNKNTEIIIKTISYNKGASYAFHYGLKFIDKYDFDFVYLSDDDAFPDINLFSKFNRVIDYFLLKIKNLGIISTKVVSHNEIDLNHRRIINYSFLGVTEKKLPLQNYSKKYFSLNLVSFVGIFIQRQVIRVIQPPINDLFIFYDDTDYSLRVSKKFKIICIPELKVFHDSNSINNSFSWRNYYSFRNKLYMIKNNFNSLYLVFEIIKYLFVTLLYLFKDGEVYKCRLIAYNDFKNNKKGLSPVYNSNYSKNSSIYK